MTSISAGCGTVLILVAGFLSGCETQTSEQTVDLTVPVTVEPVALGTVESTLEATGTLRSVRVAEVLTEARGFVFFKPLADGRKLSVGVEVKEGQPLAYLENEELELSARLTSRRMALENARTSLNEKEVLIVKGMVSQFEVDTDRKALVDAQSDYENALLQLKKKEVPAPLSGFISELADITEGTRIEQGTLLCRIVDYSQVLLDLRIPSSQVRNIHLGQQVRVSDYSFPDESFIGSIEALDPVVDPATRTFKAVAGVANPERLLRPGMFVKAEIVVESRRNVVAVPRQYIVRRRNNQVVFVEENARAQMRQVETGLEDGLLVEIIEGLDEGERLITSNHETLRPRARVRVTGDGTDGPAGR
jgi:membrane fusion protein, multidrug efflux system